MALDISGTLRRVILDGTTFDVMADANVTETGSSVENEGIPTSGRNMRKMTRRVEKREGVILACNGDEREILKDLSERTTDFPMSLEYASGDIYRAVGWIEFENRETEENRATITMDSRLDWESFLAA